MTIILCDYTCGKESLDTLYSGKVTDPANGSSHNNAGSALIRCEALGRPACNSSCEEQRWFPTLSAHSKNVHKWRLHRLPLFPGLTV